MSFTPRPEFIKEPAHTRHNFSLLTLAGSSCIRLYSFPLELISALRRLFGENAVAYREDVVNNFCEFSIDGKPWASPKSIISERLLVGILAVVYHHGYTCLSSINYGREHDESLALAFSIPGQSDSPQSPDRLSNPATRRTPFAISFVSATLIRVISPPLHSTPAILQAVRGSWPRGVVSEKKVGHNSYDFRLKGYKWFQEDTFATDSLRHILALLSALDAHSFVLSTSITLSTRSKVKDLWILTVPSPAGEETCFTDTPSVLTSSLPDLKRVLRTSDNLPSQHRRNATEPAQVIPASPLPEHPRAVSDDVRARPVSLLRKPAPRAQIPISVHDESGEGSNSQSHVPTTTPDIFYATSPFGTVDVDKREINQQSPDGSDRSKSPSQNDSPAPVPVLVVANGRSSSPPASSNIQTSTPSTPGELLGPTAFRDSAFSSCTDMSADIPIKWTGVNRESEIRPPLSERESHQPVIPGGWQPTPIQEKPEQLLELAMDQDKDPDEPVQDVAQRVASPEMNRVSSDIRRSEAGVVEMASSEYDGETSKGKGWVLVNVEGKPSNDSAKDTTNPVVTESPKSASPDASGVEEIKNEAHPNATMSPAAKAIVIIDAVEAKKSKSSDSAQSPSKIKRLLSLRKRNSTPADSTAGIGQRFKFLRTPQATRRDGKRRSIDG